MPEMLKSLRFYKLENSTRTILFRWAETIRSILLERWNRESNSWVSAPILWEATGIGGSADFDLISEDEAVFLIASKTISPVDAVRLTRAGL